MKRRSGMADSALDVRNLICALIGALLVTMGLASHSHAADLKDVRIGEYSDYTRVVFEFDKPIDQEDQIVQSSSRLMLMFPETEAGLVRKIPFQRSKRINNIQLWARKNNLSIVLLFNFAIDRYESFRMREPFRIALDIYPKTGLAGDHMGPSPKINQKPILAREPKTLVTMDSTEMTAPTQNQKAPDRADAPTKIENAGQTILPQDHDLETANDLPPPNNRSQFSNMASGLSRIRSSSQGSASLTPSDQFEEGSRNSGSLLQYYLIITLVIITIIILGLLTIMLLMRHRWTDEDKPMQIDGLLKQQDDRIASLNARIQEQLKRYDEA